MEYYVHESSFIDNNVHIGGKTCVWHFSHIQEGAWVGENCTIGQNVYIGSKVKIGDKCKIQNNVSVYEGVEMEDGVFCGPSMVFTNDLTPRAEYPKGRLNFKKTLVKKGASIGANATIICGHIIGSYAMVAAGAVVAEDVPEYAIVAGIPARRIGWACVCGKKLDGSLECPDCGRRYKEADNTLFILSNQA